MSDQPQLPLDLNDDRVEPLEHCTDLPLPLSGNGGNSAPDVDTAARLEELVVRLDETLRVPAAPPLHELHLGTVRAWMEEAAEGLRWRRDRTAMIREADRLLHEVFRTRQTIEVLREQLTSKAAQQREKEAGTYWRRRDGGRRAQQPMHVEVDPAAWRRAKALAARQGVGIGEYVGRLILAELRAPSRRRVPAPEATTHLFARIAIEKDEWRRFVASARELDVTVQRRVGLIVERL